MDVFEDISTNHGVQISLHEVESQVDVTVILCLDDVLHSNQIVVTTQGLKIHDLAKCPLGISGISECVKTLLHCNHRTGSLLYGLPHDAITVIED